jgi:hypothetical protein
MSNTTTHQLTKQAQDQFTDEVINMIQRYFSSSTHLQNRINTLHRLTDYFITETEIWKEEMSIQAGEQACTIQEASMFESVSRSVQALHQTIEVLNIYRHDNGLNSTSI